MPPSLSPKVEKALQLNYHSEKENIWLTRQKTLRKLVGLLGVGLPPLLWLVLANRYTHPLYSISHYYFTRACPIFIIVVSLMGIFLLVCKGKEPVDFYVSSIAGLFALSLLVFPTNNLLDVCKDRECLCSVTILPDSSLRPNFHYASAGIFLACLASMSLFLFTKSDKSRQQRGRPKRRRNRVYRTCGVIMVLALLVVLAHAVHLIRDEVFLNYHLTFWMETVAVESFGFAWLTKAEIFFSDVVNEKKSNSH